MKLRVGDIELDSGEPPASARRRAAAQDVHQTPAVAAGYGQLDRLFGVVGVVAVLIGAAQVLLGRIPAWSFWTMLGVLVVVNVSTRIFQRVIKPAKVDVSVAPVAAPTELTNTEEPVALGRERQARVLRALSVMGPEGAQFSELERALGWVEPVLAQTLSAMIASDQIEEELDVETGHWSYKISEEVILGWDEGADAAGVSLAQRLERTAAEVITTTPRSKR